MRHALFTALLTASLAACTGGSAEDVSQVHTGHTDLHTDTDGDETDTDGAGGGDTDGDTDGAGETGLDDTGDGLGTDTDDGTAGDTDTDAPWARDTGWWWDTSVFQPGLASCLPEDLPLGWVFGGRPGEDWIVSTYVDLDPSPGLRDYAGNTALLAKTRDGAHGISVDVPNLRWMDQGFPVLALADGYVVDWQDGHEDRNTSCSGDPNYVVLRHDNGFLTIYGHLKKDSVRVRRGQRVAAGAVLGVVGSSGCSTHPHVGLQVLDCDGAPIDPFALEMFVDPPAYDTPLRFMDAHVFDVPVDRLEQLADPVPDAAELLANRMVGFGLTASGGEPGDRILVELWRPDGVIFEQIPVTLTAWLQRHHWWWNRRLGDFRGTWKLVVKMNDVVVDEREFFVHAQMAALAVAEADLASVLAQHRALELEPVWLDAYTVRGAWFYNLLSEPGAPAHELWWGLEQATHEARLAEAEARGLKPIHLDAATDGSVTRYLAIVEADDGTPWEAYAGLDGADHWDAYVTLETAHWRPSVLVATGDTFDPVWTALWDDRDVGTYLTLTDIPRPDFFGMHQVQRAAGRYLSTLDARVVDGEPYLLGVWDERDRGRWSLKTLLELEPFETTHTDNRMQSMRLRAISGYERFGGHRFAAWWTEY